MTVLDEPILLADPAETAASPRGMWRTALGLWRTRVGLGLLAGLVALAVIGPWLAPYGETEFVGTPNLRDVEGATLGTDYFGQDVLSRFLYGGRSILVLAVLSTALALVSGVTIGLVAAYSRGLVDNVLMRLMDINLAFPQLLLALVALTTIGPKAWVIVLVVGFTTMPRIARVTRGAAVPVVERDFVSAAQALGESRFRILRSEILPNVSGPLLVEANLRLTYSIAIIAALGFLGFATSVNAANWGLMIQENKGAVSVQPWGMILPGLAIALLTVGTGLVGDGLARAAAGIDRKKAT
ncbi:MAG TPA: ABC transporter permease [Acidimicrobiales bacterium]|nr:ABC transporter permease [Acidimicrobiales bacterium]